MNERKGIELLSVDYYKRILDLNEKYEKDQLVGRIYGLGGYLFNMRYK